MSRLTRYTQKLFGSGASTNQIAEFGSLAASSPERFSGSTITPAIIQTLTNYSNGWFDAVIGQNSPALEDMNALDYLFAYQLSYLMQAGVAEWDSGTTYYTNQMVNYQGIVYVSQIDTNLNNIPSSSPSDWSNLIPTAIGQQELLFQGWSAFGSTDTNVIQFTNTITNVGTDLTFVNNSVNGTVVTVNTSGLYAVAAALGDVAGGFSQSVIISKNATVLNSPIAPVSGEDPDWLVFGQMPLVVSQYSSLPVSRTTFLSSGDIIRVQSNAGSNSLLPGNMFSIVRVS